MPEFGHSSVQLEPQTLNLATTAATHTLNASLRAGWHRLRLRIDTPDRIGVRKELRIDAGAARLATLTWNRTLNEDFLVHLDVPATGLQLHFRHATSPLQIRRFSLRRVSSVRTGFRAVRAKVQLLNQFNCLGPVLGRGGRLLLRGDFGTFSRKLLKALPDSRVMRIEAKQAEEANAAWWRRRAWNPEQLAALKIECEALDDPVPVAVLIPVDRTRVDHARLATFSVLRQVYPHWQLRLLWAGAKPPKPLSDAIRHDDRAAIVVGENLDVALQNALSEVPCDLGVMLSPDAELREDALLRMTAMRENTRFQDSALLASMKDLATRPDRAGGTTSSIAFLRDVMPLAKATSTEPLVHSLDTGGASALPLTVPPVTKTLHLAANVTGISGWDALAFQMLRGLSRAGIAVKRHPAALVKTHTLPPGLSFDESPRLEGDPQLIVAAPFQVKPFAPDSCTAIFTMWECDRLPPREVHVLNEARLVIVPSEWSHETFRASGVTVPIDVVPLGIDPLVFHPRNDVQELCVFGTAGALGAGGIRKNLSFVVKAFQAAFPGETDVRLRIKMTPNCPPLEIDDPRIDITRAVLPVHEVAVWNRSLTCYVNSSFAEGYGLHLLEAMACGVPLISSAVSGPAEYFDESVGLVVPHREVPVKNEYYDGRWYEPDFDSAVAAMRQVYHDRQATRTLGEAAAARARGYTWRDTGRKLLASLHSHGVLS